MPPLWQIVAFILAGYVMVPAVVIFYTQTVRNLARLNLKQWQLFTWAFTEAG